MLGITLRTVVRKYAEALDRLTKMFLRKGLLRVMQECKQKEEEVPGSEDNELDCDEEVDGELGLEVESL